MDAAYAQTIHKVLSTFGVDPAAGLSEDQISKLRAKHGRNCMSHVESLRARAAVARC